MTVIELIRRVGKARKNGEGWLVQCPGHTDRTPSLSIHEKDGRILLKCFAGCAPEAVVSALGLKMADLFVNGGASKTERRIIATYNYTDEARNLLYQVVRFEPKGFAQRRPDGRGGWLWNLDGVRRVLYNLSEVLKAETIFIVEGEKDAETLRGIGLTTTTNCGGAGKWLPEYSEHLKGKRVIILPDNGRPGRDHAEQVAQSIHGVAASVKIVTLPELPEKGDATDFLSRGKTRDDLERVVISTPAWMPKKAGIPGMVCLQDVTPEAVSWLWPGYIPAGKITLIDGDPGLGKSAVALDLAARVSTGQPMPDGTSTLQGGAVLLSLEDGLADTIVPRLKTVGADLSRIVALQSVQDQDGKSCYPTVGDTDAIRAAVRKVDARLVIIDPLMAYLGKADSWRDQDVRQALGPLAKMAEETGVAVLVIRHLNKSGGTHSVYRGGGSIGIIGAARCALLVAKDPEDENRRVLAGIKRNLAPSPSSLSFGIESAEGASRIVWGGVSNHSADALLALPASQEDRSAVDEALGFLRAVLEDGPVAVKEVQRQARAAGVMDATLRRAKKVLDIRSEKSGFGGKGGWSWVVPLKDAQNMPKMLNQNNEHLRQKRSQLGCG